MTNEDRILRIKNLISELGMSNGKFADEIGINRGDFSKYINGKLSISEKLMNKVIVSFPNLNPSWLLYGAGNMFNSSQPTTNININRTGNIHATHSAVATGGSALNIGMAAEHSATGTPYFGMESAACGALSGYGDSLTANNSDGSVVIPTLPTKDGDIFLQTKGRSMIDRKCPERSIPEGSMVLVRRWTQRFIEWGEIYCVATADGFVVKRLMPGSSAEYISCVSADTENYPTYEIPTCDIKSIGRVIAIVSTQLL